MCQRGTKTYGLLLEFDAQRALVQGMLDTLVVPKNLCWLPLHQVMPV